MQHIEFDSAARLAHLGRVADARSLAVRDLQHRRNDLAQALGRVRRAHAERADIWVAGRFGEARAAAEKEAAERAKAEADEIAALEAELAGIEGSLREAQNAAQDALALHERCQAFAAEKGLPRPSLFGSAAAASHGTDNLSMIGGRA